MMCKSSGCRIPRVAATTGPGSACDLVIEVGNSYVWDSTEKRSCHATCAAGRAHAAIKHSALAQPRSQCSDVSSETSRRVLSSHLRHSMRHSGGHQSVITMAAQAFAYRVESLKAAE